MIPATRMAAVLTLQVLHDYSDRETAEAVRFDVRWKAAIGTALDYAGSTPDPGVLAEPDREVEAAHRINDAVKTVVAQTGICAAGAAGPSIRRLWLTAWRRRTR